MTFRLTTKIVLVAFGLILIAATLGGYGLGRIRIEELVGKEQQTLAADAELASKQLTSDLDHLREDVLFLSTVAPIQGIVRAHAADGIDPASRVSEQEWQQRLTMLFEALLKQRPDYFQIRFIGAADEGKEIVRVERAGGRVYATSAQELQQKGKRYYVRDTMVLPPGQVYMSPIDLNREHGEIQVPYIPTMRVATPIYSPEGEPFGLVIINVNIGVTLDRIANIIQPPLRVYVVNNEGDYLLQPDRAKTFGFDFGKHYRIQDDFPILQQVFRPDLDAEQRPLRQLAGNGVTGALFHYLKVATDPLDPSRHLAIVVGIDDKDIAQEQRALLTQHFAFAVLLTLFAMSITLWLLRRITAPLKELTRVAAQISAGNYNVVIEPSREPEVDTLNRAIRAMTSAINEREQLLRETNEQLEQRVNQRTADLHASEQRLNEQQALLRLIIDSIDEGIIVADVDGRFVLWNKAATAQVGSAMAEIPPEQWAEHYQVFKPDRVTLFEPDELPLVRAMRGEHTSPIEIYIATDDDSHSRWLSVAGHPLYNADGEVTAGVVALHDVTAYKRLEADLRAARNRLHHLLSESPAVIYSLPIGATAANFVSANVRALLGYRPEQIIGNSDWWQSHLHPDDHDKIAASSDSSKWPGGAIRRRYRLRTVTGSYVWVEDQCTLVYEDGGKATELVGSLVNITGTIAANERLEKIALNIPGMVFQYQRRSDGTAFFPYASSGIHDIYGVSPEAVAEDADTALHLIHPADAARVVAAMDASASDLSHWHCEFRIRQPRGRELWAEGHATPERLPNGDTVWYGYISEITPRKEAEIALRNSEANLANAQRIARLGSWDWDIVNGTLHWSDEIYRIFGLLPQEFAATYEAFLERVHPDDRTAVTTAVDAALAHRAPYATEHRIVLPSGEERIVFEQADIRFGADGKPEHMTGTVLDITERKRSEERIRLLASVFEHGQEGILITDAEQKIVAVNRSFTRLTGYELDEVQGKTPRMLRSGWHDHEFYQAMWRSLTETGAWKGELHDRRKNGELYVEWLTILAIKNDQGDVTNYIGMFEDITQEKEAEQRIAHLAYHDTLTDLANRRLFEDRLEQALRHAHRASSKTALLYVDLDRFKPINDTFGHKAGDLLLKEVAQRLSACVRDSDTVARLGGDEFALVLHGVDQNHASITAQRAIDALARPFQVDQHDVFIGASIGIGIYPSDGVDVTTLVKHADIAMYQAKQAGRNTYRFFKPEMNIGALERLQLENDLRRAIEQQEFELYYQPQVDIPSGRIVGAEALVRWHHPERGLITPATFIRLSEETGLIVPIGAWVLEQACRQAVSWRAHAPAGFRIAVNLSARQFQPQILDTVSETLRRTGAAPQALELELTESMVMQDPDAAIGLLRAMADLGIQLAIDDFGTGYSSLSYLKRFPLHKLKVDRSFVQDIPADNNDAAITSATIALAHSLNLKVIAEGVETSEQLAFLRRQGCDQYQGYYCSHPVPAGDFAKLLANEQCGDE